MLKFIRSNFLTCGHLQLFLVHLAFIHSHCVLLYTQETTASEQQFGYLWGVQGDAWRVGGRLKMICCSQVERCIDFNTSAGTF